MDGSLVRTLFGTNLKRLRKRSGLSQLALANTVGMTHNFINDIENGKKWVSPATIEKLSKALKAPPYQFFLSEYDSENPELLRLNAYMDDVAQSVLKAVEETKKNYIKD